MVSEVKILFEKNDAKNKKGHFFEKIVGDILESQRYKVCETVNFTGMEIDLIAEHKDRTNEKIFVECKATDNLASKDIGAFFSKVFDKEAKYGYFISTNQFKHQVAGRISEMKKDKRYDFLYFFGPEDIIKFLNESNKVNTTLLFDCPNGLKISKEILVYMPQV